MFYRGRLTQRHLGVDQLDIDDEDFEELLHEAREDLREKREARMVPRRRRSTRTRERPYTATEVKVASRRKQNCWARKMHFIELVFERYGSGRLKEGGPTVREATRTAGLSSWYMALWTIRVYRKNGCRLRHPSEPHHKRIYAYRRLDYYKDVLFEKLWEWRFDNLQQRANRILDMRLPLRDREGNI